jgi:hypothetical protein
MKMQQTEPIPLFCHNQVVLKLDKNPIFHERTKHVEIQFHFIKQLKEDGSIVLQYRPTKVQTANIFTKSLGPQKYVKFQDKLSVVSRLAIKGGC